MKVHYFYTIGTFDDAYVEVTQTHNVGKTTMLTAEEAVAMAHDLLRVAGQLSGKKAKEAA